MSKKSMGLQIVLVVAGLAFLLLHERQMAFFVFGIALGHTAAKLT